MFEGPETLECGCLLVLKESDPVDGEPVVSLLFMTPCSADHKMIAERVRGMTPGRSSLVVKAVRS